LTRVLKKQKWQSRETKSITRQCDTTHLNQTDHAVYWYNPVYRNKNTIKPIA